MEETMKEGKIDRDVHPLGGDSAEESQRSQNKHRSADPCWKLEERAKQK